MNSCFVEQSTTYQWLELAGDLVHKIPVDEHFTEAAPDYEIVWNAIGGILDQATKVLPFSHLYRSTSYTHSKNLQKKLYKINTILWSIALLWSYVIHIRNKSYLKNKNQL